MVKRSFAASFLLALPLAAACGSVTSPAGPTVTASVVSVAVTAAAPSGAGFQLMAMAALSDGTSKDVTAASAWESSSPALATVSAAGFVTVLGAGEVDFRATYQSAVGALHRTVVQSRYLLGGRIGPVFPNLPQYLSGVRVDITGGPNAGASAFTDVNGFFSFPGLSAGTVALRVASEGYLVWSISNLRLEANETIDATLFPMPPLDPSGVRATAQCNDATWTWTQTRDRACTGHGGVAWGVCPGPVCDSLVSSIR
jgi:hypothetical protein